MPRTLTLKKETLAELSPADLAFVHGGAIPTYACPTHDCVERTKLVVATVISLTPATTHDLTDLCY